MLRVLVPVAIGVAVAALALGVAELVAGLFGVRSPVIAVGDGVIDLTPAPVKDFAIRTFGTKDKLALLVGIFSMLVAVAVAVGVVVRYSLIAAVVLMSTFAAVGIVAGLASPDPKPQVLFPAPVGAAAGAGALVFARRFPGVARTGARGRADTTADAISGASSSAEHPILNRRKFLTLTGGLVAAAAATAALGRLLQSQLSAAASRAGVTLPSPATRLAPVPSGTSVGVDGVAPFVTSNADFYRIDTALTVPQVQTDSWALRVTGMVNEELEIDFEELLSRPMVEADITMTCVSNVVGGDLMSHARWLGVPLRKVLDEAGVDPKRATQIVGRSVDGFTTGFPTERAYDGRDALIAVGMNGEPLPLEHGFPARLVIAGLYGYVSATKWLEEIELTTMEGFDAYWVRRRWGKEGPIKVQSRIDVPKGFARVPAGSAVVAGVAWAQPHGISRVEVRVDGGPWSDATLADELNGSTWRQWRWQWNAAPGLHTVTVRATDKRGVTQTEQRAEPIPDGATGWHSVSATVVA